MSRLERQAAGPFERASGLVYDHLQRQRRKSVDKFHCHSGSAGWATLGPSDMCQHLVTLPCTCFRRYRLPYEYSVLEWVRAGDRDNVRQLSKVSNNIEQNLSCTCWFSSVRAELAMSCLQAITQQGNLHSILVLETARWSSTLAVCYGGSESLFARRLGCHTVLQL